MGDWELGHRLDIKFKYHTFSIQQNIDSVWIILTKVLDYKVKSMKLVLKDIKESQNTYHAPAWPALMP